MRKTILSTLTALLLGVSIVSGQEVPSIKAELAFKAEASTGEGSIWHPGRQSLFWVDIEGKTLYETAGGRSDSWKFDRMVSTVVPESDSTVIVSLKNEVVRVFLPSGKTESVSPIPDHDGFFRCNDGKCDPAGRLWIGTMRYRGQGSGEASLYTLTADGQLKERLTGVTISNGIVWTADKKYMYYNDTPTGHIQRFRYDPATGDIAFDGIAVVLPARTGGPDGMTIDSEGNLWVAQWGGYGVYCYDPRTGELLKKVAVPAPNVASCAFGGENLDELYITTARAWLPDEKLQEYSLSGSLFVCKPGAVGVPANYFGRENR